jgi:hypothetical protein
MSTESTLPNPKRKHRWLQFRLRSALLLMLLLAVGMRWMAVIAEREREAVDAIIKDGGAV